MITAIIGYIVFPWGRDLISLQQQDSTETCQFYIERTLYLMSFDTTDYMEFLPLSSYLRLFIFVRSIVKKTAATIITPFKII